MNFRKNIAGTFKLVSGFPFVLRIKPQRPKLRGRARKEKKWSNVTTRRAMAEHPSSNKANKSRQNYARAGPITSRFLLMLPLLLASCAHHWSSELPATHPEADRVYRYLHPIVIPQVELVDAHVLDAVAFLCDATRRCSPDGQGISVILEIVDSDKKVTIRRASMGSLNFISPMTLALV